MMSILSVYVSLRSEIRSRVYAENDTVEDVDIVRNGLREFCHSGHRTSE